MVEGRSRDRWGHTSSVICVIANAHRDPKKRRRPFQPGEFNPHNRAAARRARGRKGFDVDRFARDLLAVSRAKQRERKGGRGEVDDGR